MSKLTKKKRDAEGAFLAIQIIIDILQTDKPTEEQLQFKPLAIEFLQGLQEKLTTKIKV